MRTDKYGAYNTYAMDLLCDTYVECFYSKGGKLLLLLVIPLHPRGRETLLTRVASLLRPTITPWHFMIIVATPFIVVSLFPFSS